jgi:hypothetical protein
MAKRHSLTEGVTQAEPELDPELVRALVFDKKPKPAKTSPAAKAAAAPLPAGNPNPTNQSSRHPLGARIRDEIFFALKRASFDRQLQGIEPNTQQDIVEEALTPWLRKHGYLP